MTDKWIKVHGKYWNIIQDIRLKDNKPKIAYSRDLDKIAKYGQTSKS